MKDAAVAKAIPAGIVHTPDLHYKKAEAVMPRPVVVRLYFYT
jgi:hypothetical protein